MMKRFIMLFTLLALGSLAFAQPFVWPNAWTDDAGEAQSGGTLRLFSISDPRTFNPFVSSEQNAVIDYTDAEEGAYLIIRDPENPTTFIPYAAESFTQSEDGLVVDMVLREGVMWSDGTPVTVQDYFFRYQAETDEEVGSNAYDSYFIEGEQILLEINGERELRWTFPAPDREAFGVAALTPAPDHILGEIYREGGAEALRAAWGTESNIAETVWTSPWVPTSFSPGERVVFERNPYFGEWNVDEDGNPLPYLDGLVVNIVENSDAALNLYIAGELDAFVPRGVDDIGVINVAIQNGDIDATVLESVSPQAASQFIVFNWNKAGDPFREELFRNADFRRAMAHLMDRESIIDLVYGGAASPMYSNVYRVLDFWVNDDIETYDFNPEAALDLLASIGFTETNGDGVLVDEEGNALEFTLVTNSGNPQREQIAQIFGDTAREYGVGIDVQAIDFNLMVEQLLSTGEERPFDAILIGLFRGSIDWPFGANVIPCGSNLHMFSGVPECLADFEEEMSNLYFEGRATLDDDEAQQIAYRIQEIGAANVPILFTVSPDQHYSWLNRVGGNYPVEMIDSIVSPRQRSLTFIR